MAFLLFDGNGFISTDDVNLLDADTAHLEQSRGLWVTRGIAGGALVRQADPLSGLGNYSMEMTYPTGIVDPTWGVEMSAPISGIPDGTVVTVGAFIRPGTRNSASIGVRVSAGGGQILPPVTVVPPEGAWVFNTTTTYGGPSDYRVSIGSDITGESAGSVHISAIVLRFGANQTFVPSLRIVGVLDETITPPDMPIVFAADGTPLTVGAGWTGDGFSYIRMDGTGGPIVAEFDPGDIL